MQKKAKTYILSIILLLLLLSPNLYACGVASDLNSPLKAIIYMAVVGIGLAIPMIFLRRRTYFILCGILCLIPAPIEIASLYLNHNPASTTFIGLFYATNYREVIGIVSVVWPLLIMLVVIWGLYFMIALRQPNEWIIPHKVGLLIIGISLPIFLGGGLLFFSQFAKKIYHMQTKTEVLDMAKQLIVMKFHKIFPYNIYLNTSTIIAERYEMIHAQEELASFRFGFEQKEDKVLEIYVLVIGESARSDNFALNGYERSTTPRLNQRKNIISYLHSYSQAGTTELSVPQLLSRLPVTKQKEIRKEKTLPEAFQEAGFRISWLTNKSHALYLQRMLEEMDWRFETGKDMSVTNNYDELLLDPLQETLNDEACKQFIVLHTMGSHWKYNTRYPTDFEQFTPSIGKDFKLNMIRPENRDLLVNAYDNTILYTDYFLDKICSTLENEHVPTLMIYMSDHGENLYDDDRGLILHGNYGTSKWLFHVPLIIWYSDEYAQLYPDKIKHLKAHQNVRDNSSMLFYSMIDAAGLRYKNDTEDNALMRTRSIFSKDYKVPDTLFVLTTEGDCIPLEDN